MMKFVLFTFLTFQEIGKRLNDIAAEGHQNKLTRSIDPEGPLVIEKLPPSTEQYQTWTSGRVTKNLKLSKREGKTAWPLGRPILWFVRTIEINVVRHDTLHFWGLLRLHERSGGLQCTPRTIRSEHILHITSKLTYKHWPIKNKMTTQRSCLSVHHRCTPNLLIYFLSRPVESEITKFISVRPFHYAYKT